MNLLHRQHPTATLAAHEKFFLELWYGMTHEASLDSHRVRCLNARTIIRELDQELRICRARPEEFQDICAEAEEILEFLAHVSQGENIGRTVAIHASDALLQRYLYRLVSDVTRTVREQATTWDSDLATTSGVTTLGELGYPGALKLLQSQALAEKLAQGFPENPVGGFRIRRLAAALQDPKKTAELLFAHHRHLLWQLGRLYRIRCCIVHGSAVRFKLPLLTANLEFYLKELILVCLRSLSLNYHVCSLREVFQRAAVARQRADTELRAANPPADAIRCAVFNSVIVQENP